MVTFALLSTGVLSLAWASQPGDNAGLGDRMEGMGMSGTSERCAAMKKMCDEMASKQKDADVRLERLVATMNDASGSTKVDAMAAVISELVIQRAEHRTHTMHAEAAMKEHLMHHVMASAPGEMANRMKRGVDECSMMKGRAGENR